MAPDPTRPQVPRIPLAVHPAYLGIVDALRAAWSYWLSTATQWILPVAAVGLVSLLAELVLGGSSIDAPDLQSVVVTTPLGPDLDMAQLPRIVAGPAAVAVVTIVARWFLVANAIGGLRGREPVLTWVLSAGVRAFVADLLVALTFTTAVSFALAAGWLGLVLMAAGLPLAVYAGVRLQLWVYAIFDGQSVLGGGAASWRMTRGGVLRVLGWTLAMAGLGLLLAVPLTVIDLVTASMPAIGAVLGGVADTTLTAYSVIVVALLYESQRLRTDPVAYAASLPASPAPPEPRGPFDPPPPPPHG